MTGLFMGSQNVGGLADVKNQTWYNGFGGAVPHMIIT